MQGTGYNSELNNLQFTSTVCKTPLHTDQDSNSSHPSPEPYQFLYGPSTSISTLRRSASSQPAHPRARINPMCLPCTSHLHLVPSPRPIRSHSLCTPSSSSPFSPTPSWYACNVRGELHPAIESRLLGVDGKQGGRESRVGWDWTGV
jgi:hypothetical protein